MGVPVLIEGELMLLERSVRLWCAECRFVCFELPRQGVSFSGNREFTKWPGERTLLTCKAITLLGYFSAS
jgi:hypothetical protein